MIKVFIDGSIGPKNPGKIASYGFEVRRNGVIVHAEGGLVAKSDESVYTNNVAEYGALIAFFNWYLVMLRIGRLKVDGTVDMGKSTRTWVETGVIYSDSQLIVNQMNGKWSAGQGTYLPYYRLAAKEFITFSEFMSIKWIPREQNEIADELSKYSRYLNEPNGTHFL